MLLKNICLGILTFFLFLNTNLLAEDYSIKKDVSVVDIQKFTDKQKWIQKEELSTFTSAENLMNSFLRKILNNIIIFIKKISAEGLVGSIIGFLLACVLFGSSVVTLPILLILVALNDLYYLNPLATLGLIFDYYATVFKLLCSIFGWYI